MKTYKNETDKYKDVESTAWSFCIVGVLGLIILGLMWANVIPINVPQTNKIMITVVMGIMLLIFTIIGIKSFLSLKQLKIDLQKEEDSTNAIIEWFITEMKSAVLAFPDDPELSEEENYLQKSEFICGILLEKDESLSEEELDYLSEEIYNKIFE